MVCKMQFVDLKAQYHAYQAEIDAAIKEVTTSAQFINGPQVRGLEESLADFVGTKHAVACASGTDALQLALMVSGIGPGDEVITTPFTFIATAETIVLAGARPVFVDIEEHTYNLDPALLESAITGSTKAIIAVDLYGHPAAYEKLEKLAEKHGLKLIEDAAQSLGAARLGRNCGSFGDLAATSFFPAKPIGCYGDGGMIFTDDAEIAETLCCLRNHGQKKRYYHEVIGCNSRLDTLQAAILLVKLAHFPDEISLRIQVAARYNSAFADHFIIPRVADGCVSVFAQYSLRSQKRDEIVGVLQAAGIPVAIHYPVPLHLQPAFSNLGCRIGDFPVAEKIASEIFSLPMHSFLTKEEQNLVIATVLKAV